MRGEEAEDQVARCGEVTFGHGILPLVDVGSLEPERRDYPGGVVRTLYCEVQ